jgi:sulfite exporter TauE/SafE
MLAYALIFLAGFAGSFHCLGMCGGFACALGAGPRGNGTRLERQLVYNIGRVGVYCFLGALAGFLGMTAIIHYDSGADSVIAAQRLLAFASGALMLVIGLRFLGYLGRLGYHTPGYGGQFLVPVLRDLLQAPGRAAPLAFGVFNGFLPCPLVYAFLAQAATSGGPLNGVLVMVAFGLGTFPAMLLMGGLGARLRFEKRLRGVQIAGVFLVVLGLITLARGGLVSGDHGRLDLSGVSGWFCSLPVSSS